MNECKPLFGGMGGSRSDRHERERGSRGGGGGMGRLGMDLGMFDDDGPGGSGLDL